MITADYLLTLHEERVSLPAILGPELPEERGKRYVVYSVLDAMLGSAFDALEEVELRLDALAASWTEGHGAGISRAELRDAGAQLAAMRRWVRAEQRSSSGSVWRSGPSAASTVTKSGTSTAWTSR